MDRAKMDMKRAQAVQHVDALSVQHIREHVAETLKVADLKNVVAQIALKNVVHAAKVNLMHAVIKRVLVHLKSRVQASRAVDQLQDQRAKAHSVVVSQALHAKF